MTPVLDFNMHVLFISHTFTHSLLLTVSRTMVKEVDFVRRYQKVSYNYTINNNIDSISVYQLHKHPYL